jgi:hypothetical protein
MELMLAAEMPLHADILSLPGGAVAHESIEIAVLAGSAILEVRTMRASGAESAPGLGHAAATSAQLGSPLQCWARLRSRLSSMLCAACCMQVACRLVRVACCMVHVVCAQVTISGQLDGQALAAWLVAEFETGRWSSLQTRCARVQRAAWCTALQDGVLHCNSGLQQNTLCCSMVY